MRVKCDLGAYSPTRAHPTVAGLDLRAKTSGIVRARNTWTFGTGVHVELPKNTVGILLPKSGLMTKHDIITFGVVDEPYRGEIMVHMINLSDQDYQVHAGDKISQLIVMPVRYEDVEVVDELSESDRGENGFGSSGR